MAAAPCRACGGKGEIRRENAQGVGALDGRGGFVDPAGGVGRHPEIEPELGREKAVGGPALGRTVVVALKGE